MTTQSLLPCSNNHNVQQHLALVMDTSSFIQPKDFKLLKDFAINFARVVTRRPKNKFGFITYSNKANVVIPVINTKPINAIEADIRSITQGINSRRTDLGIDAAVNQLGGIDFTNPIVKIMILITTGIADYPSKVITSTILLKSRLIFGIPIGINSAQTQSVTHTELATFILDLTKPHIIYVVDKFEDLEGKLANITDWTCSILNTGFSRSGRLRSMQPRRSCKRYPQGG